VARGAAAKRSSPDVTQTEISDRVLGDAFSGPGALTDAAAGSLGTIPVTSPSAEIPRKSRRVGAFVTVVSFVRLVNNWFVGTSGRKPPGLLIYVAAKAATHKTSEFFNKLLHKKFPSRFSIVASTRLIDL
jgi:hypothetical protein